jgi:hypothetical protein
MVLKPMLQKETFLLKNWCRLYRTKREAEIYIVSWHDPKWCCFVEEQSPPRALIIVEDKAKC